jgi:SAM-dependent methyltransferase
MTRWLRKQRHGKVSDGNLYRVDSGPKQDLIFYAAFGHKRPVLSVEDYERVFAGVEPALVDAETEAALPLGPPVATHADPLAEVLAEATDTWPIRQALCADLGGRGYEIGAGDRPAPVPLSCHVTYVDRFTFDEASDGSFVGTDSLNHVHVSIRESIEHMPSIADGTADFFIACHVIEHVSDPIAGLEELHRKLKPGGHAILVVPDGRYTFDASRPPTTVEHMLADHLSPGRDELDHYLEYFRRAAGDTNWVEVASEGAARDRDIHKHVFTPETMSELLSLVREETPFSRVEVLEPVQGPAVQEFYVLLER